MNDAPTFGQTVPPLLAEESLCHKTTPDDEQYNAQNRITALNILSLNNALTFCQQTKLSESPFTFRTAKPLAEDDVRTQESSPFFSGQCSLFLSTKTNVRPLHKEGFFCHKPLSEHVLLFKQQNLFIS